MKQPPFEVADIIRQAGTRFIERYRESLGWAQLKVLTAIARCRTAALGGHRDQCVRCGYEAISYCSCRNRHCPKCQTNARERWLRARERELLPVGYFHLVFSVPPALVPLIWQNKRVLFTLLFEASAVTLLEVAADPKHLGAAIGFLSILHTWGQTLQRHPHIHSVVPGGRLVARSHTLDRLTFPLLSARESVEPRVSRQVHRWLTTGLPTKQACLPWSLSAVGTGESVCGFRAQLVPAGLGGVRQASVWRARARSAISGALHTPGCYLES